MMEHASQRLANEKYGGNGWSEAERLVLYRMDEIESKILTLVEAIETLRTKREKDVIESKKERAEQYTANQYSLDSLKTELSNYILSQQKEETSRAEKRAEERIGAQIVFTKVERLEKIIYGLLGGVGMALILEAINRIL